MTDTNRVILVGRVTRDVGADERSFGYIGSNGTAKANVGLAVNRSRKDASGQWIEEANFFDVTIWGKQAETLKQYLTKGKQILVDGRLQQDRWEKDGQKYSKVYVVAENVQLLAGKGGNGTGESAGGYTPSAQPQSAPQPSYNSAGAAPADAPFPEDIPF